jgi:hypothetical protein
VLTAEEKDAGLGSVFKRDDERLAKMRDQVRWPVIIQSTN